MNGIANQGIVGLKQIRQLIIMGLALVLTSCYDPAESPANSISAIIPQPNQMKKDQGYFTFDKGTVLVVKNDAYVEPTLILSQRLKIAAGFDMAIVSSPPTANYVQIMVDTSLAAEAYKLSINEGYIQLKASTKNGLVYGMQSLRLLLPKEMESKQIQSHVNWSVPVMEIEDSPRYEYRGVMLDVSRHFFDIAYIKKTLDRMSLLKLNTFHWHLVDDQGWRIEIKKYPKLTEIGGFRADQEDKHWNSRKVTQAGEAAGYGGFYTQVQIKEVVDYADKLGITVVPEIEMPAHVMSAIAAYPELSCFENPIGVPSGGVWPITEIYCAGKEQTFLFLENVIDEVADLFPGTYIHIGGDEATKTNWAVCPHCKKRMQEEKLASVEELQSYFIRRMEKYINAKGKEIIGWDEILEGGLAPGAAVMSWRGTQGGMEASEQGHKVIMTPGEFCYFDQYQGPQNTEPIAIGGYLPLKKVYGFDPVIPTMTKEQESFVMGGQANLWSEYIPTEEHSEYMLFPRLLALSETLWSTKEQRNWSNFSERLKVINERLEFMGVNVSKSAYAIRDSATVDIGSKSISVKLHNEFDDADIRYAFAHDADNFIPYTAPVTIDSSVTITAKAYEDGKAISPLFIQQYDFHKGVGAKVTYHTLYNSSYAGEGESTLVNVLRGSKNFHDGQWQAWLNKDVELTIDLLDQKDISEIVLGFLQNQGPDIFYPTAISISLSKDNIEFQEVDIMEIPFKNANTDEIQEVKISFGHTKTRYIKIHAVNGPYPGNDGGSWLFMDEIKIN
ncbi:family 20 glycosylhydrolase [Maribacter confluentis]|uniref:beta-N-acetylhexosaminidase n=1 Tax=Maribacter confluentis TaxID=1656093 RepID=A0ABT8RKV3_9FLAO|nr:family 20 glycosylhydrolase [Maribacter confluentis]MDO1511570.1 family 20 glycosylhydrolase [Maribacter confluentis]